jgi:nuclear GTP-binding protein
LKKDPGVPRLPDLKVKASLKQAGKNSQRPHKEKDDDKMQIESTLLQSLPLEPEEQQESTTDDPTAHARRHYIRTLYKVIDQSDVVVLVLDARDPEGCRSRLVEEEVRRREVDSKKLMFVLNKIGDQVPQKQYYWSCLMLARKTLYQDQMLKCGFAIFAIQPQPLPSAHPRSSSEPT